MPSSATSSRKLGRQLWATLRDSVNGLISRFPGGSQPQPQLLHRSGFAARLSSPSPRQPSFPYATRSFHSSRSLPGQASKFAPGNVRRSCTSGGLLLLGLSSPSSSTQTVVASCAAAADSVVAVSSGCSKSAVVSRLALQAWKRGIHTSPEQEAASAQSEKKRLSESSRVGGEKNNATSGKAEGPNATPENSPDPTGPHTPETLTGSVSKYLHLPHLPKIPHRPTKEELLAAANGFWQRLKVRFKWLSIRSMRPYNADEWGAFVSWFMLGHLVWILVGTTTFFSLIICMVNTVFAQETLAKWIGDYLTQSAGVTVVFESAIVPKWKDGVITFRNVFVSRRPGQMKSSVKKGSSSKAAAVAAARQVNPDGQTTASDEDDGNYTQFDVTINTVNVTLSFLKWWNGTGLLKDVEVKGVRGVVDRTSIQWADGVDPYSYRHVHQPGDFEIEHFKLEDLLVTVHQPDGFRPFPVSIYSCELPQLRKQWLFHDFLYASHMSGSYDGSLFTIHPRQIHGMSAGSDHAVHNLGEPGAWKKFSRIRIDGLKIDHLNRGVEGPFGWIYEGNVDIVADLMFPADEDDSLGKVMSEFYERMEEAVTRNRYIRILENASRDKRGSKWDTPTATSSVLNEEPRGHVSNYASYGEDVETLSSQMSPDTSDLQIQDHPNGSPLKKDSSPPLSPNHPSEGYKHEDGPPRYLVMDLRIHLNDVRAAVPLFTHDISYISQPLVRPIVAYINAKRTYIPISCRIVKRISDLEGSWTVYDCGMMDDLSAEVYAAFARDVEDQHSRVRRLKKVGFWTLSMVVHALLAGVAGDLI